MIELSENERRKIQSDLLARQFPQAKALLDDHEDLMAVSRRYPHYISGVSCIVSGIIFGWQISKFFLFSSPLWAVPTLLILLALVWTGVWLITVIKHEYVLVTNMRIIHQKVDFLGHMKRVPHSILLSEVVSAHLYKKTVFFRAEKHMSGDILVKSEKKSYLIPTVVDGMELLEIMMAEVKRYRVREERNESPESSETITFSKEMNRQIDVTSI